MIEDIYKFERCSICKKFKPLKNEVCINCQEQIKMPNFLTDLFNSKEK